MSANNWRDPGWPARVWVSFLPLAGLFVMRAVPRGGVLALRGLWATLFTVPFWMLFVLVAIGGGTRGDSRLEPGAAVAGTLAIGLVGLTAAELWRRRQEPVDETDAAQKFRAAFFVRYALTDVAVVAGFVLYFMTGGSLAVYLAGMGAGLVGLVLIAPTSSLFDDWDFRHRGAQPRPPIGALLDRSITDAG